MKIDVHEYAPSATTVDAPAQTNQHSRPMLLAERTMYREGCTPFNSLFTLKLIGKLEQARLQQALARIQAKHPLLRCAVEETATGPHFVLQEQPAPIPLRLVERHGEDDWQAEARREWVMPFDEKRHPLVRLVWLRAEQVSELLLIGHHCICDGHSGINLLRELLSIYDQPEKDLGTYHALGTVVDLVPATLLQDASFQRRVRWKALLFRSASLLTIFRKKSSSPQITLEQMYFHRWHVDDSTSTMLTERCSAEGVTVLSAVSMAFMQAMRDVCGAHALNKAYTMVNARRFLPQLRADAMFGLAPGVPLLMKNLPQPQDMSAEGFWSRAQAIKSDMKVQVDRMGTDLYSNLLAFETMHDKYASMVADTENAPLVRHVTLSNMGRIDLPQQYQSFRLESVYSPLVMVSPTPANTVVFSSFAGQMEFAIISDEHSLPSSQARAIEQRAMAILHAAVTIPARHESRVIDQPSTMRVKTT